MTSTPAETLERYRAVESALAGVQTDSAAYAALDESSLLELNRLFARSQRMLRNGGALIAGEIAVRSAPELGSQGLAQRAGHRTPEQFVKITTGQTGRDAVTAVRVGRLMRGAAEDGLIDSTTGEVVEPHQPWLAPVVEALKTRSISIEAADVIRAGLGEPNSAISIEQLRDAATQLSAAAASMDPDALGRAARSFRDELDLDGVALREEERRQKRSLRMFAQPDGTTKLIWIMDPETAATVHDLYDRATSPRRGGVRFADTARKAKADEILADERSTEQLASDAFTQLLRLGADADPQLLLGSGAPVLRVTATKSALGVGVGIARIEGQAAPISIDSALRLGCGGGTVDVTFDETGMPLDFGREQRFFTKKQKDALTLRWGGCAAPGCDRPASWCEAHHIQFWARDEGRTDLADGILLCTHHHLLFHNNGWEIQRNELGRYWLIPPAERDPEQTPIELVSQSAALRDLMRVRE